MHYLFSDGGARGNPGPTGIGALLFNDTHQLVDFLGMYLGDQTNNVGEYTALLEGLKMAAKNGVEELTCTLDSELVVKQINGEYKIKEPTLQRLAAQVKHEVGNFKSVTFKHTLRAGNKFADKMVNTVLDAAAN